MNTDNAASNPGNPEAKNRKKSENQITRLLRILQHKSDSTQGFLDYALNEAIEITESKFGYIYHYHEDRKEFVLNTWSNEVMKECSVVDPQSCYELDKTGIWGEAVRQRKPIIVNDFASENPLIKGYPEGHVHLTRFLTIPVFNDDKIVGVVGVANKSSNYTNEDLLQLQLLMDAVWKVVELRETLGREQHLKKVLLGVRNVNQLITKENDPRKLINEACNNLTETMGYFNAWIALFDQNGKISDTASSGFDGNFEMLNGQIQEGNFPKCMEKALKSGDIIVMTRPAENCPGCPLSTEYENRSGLCCPMVYDKKIYGILSVSAPADFSNLKEEHELFLEVAGDLGFALYKIEMDNKRFLAEENLKERIKELTCYSDINLILSEDHSIEDLCNSIFRHLIPAMKYPEITTVTVELDGFIFSSENGKQNKYNSIHSDIKSGGSVVGKILVYQTVDKSPMLPEEQSLINNIAQSIGIWFEKNRAGKLLEQSEEKFRLITENTADCITVMDMDLNITYVSPAVFAIRGFTVEEAMQHKMEDIFTPGSLLQVQQLYQEVKKRLENNDQEVESIVSLELEQTHKNGSTIWVDLSLSLIFNNQTKPVGIVSVARDITQRKRIEAEVKEKQRMLTTLIGNLPGMAYRCKFDKDWTMLFMSDGCIKLTGYNPDDFIHNKHLTFASIIHPGYREMIYSKWKEAVATNSFFEEEYEITTREGSPRWVWERGRGVFDEAGNLLFLEGFMTDITKRKNAEEQLKTSDKIFQHSIDMLCIAGFDGYFKVLNPAWSKTLGYTTKELLSKPWVEFVHPDDVKATSETGSTIVDGKEVYQFENRYICKDGSVKWLSWNSFPYPDENIMFGVARDVTEKKKNEKELTDNKNKLQSIIQVSPTGIGLLKDRVFIEINPRICEMTGYEQEELIGKDARMLYPTKEDYDFVGSVKYDMIRKTGTGSVETRWKGKNGAIIHVLLASTPLDESNISKGVTFTATDITELKLAEEELRFKEQRFRSLVQNSKDIISMYAADGTILYKSPGLKTTLGYDPDELLGSNVLDIAHPDDREKAIEMLTALSKMNNSESARFDIRALHKNGSVVWLDATLTNMLDEPGVRAIIGNYRNITERRRTTLIHKIQYNIAHAVVTAKNFDQLYTVVRDELQGLINVTNFVVALYNEQTGMLSSPFEMDEKKSKTPPSWPAANSLSGIVIKKKHSLLLRKKEIIKLAEKGEIQLRGERAECWLGVPLLLNKKPVGLIITQSYDNPDAFDQSGIEILEIIANQLSIYIENKKAEETAQKLSKAIVQSPASIVITDPNGTIEYVNPKFTELTGYTLREAIGEKPSILKSGEHNEEFYKNLWDTITAGKDWSGEFRDKKKNGETYWESASISPLVNENGEITHFVAVKEDITEKKKMIVDLIEAKEQAEASDKLKTSFMNNISHEIRTPLNGIIGFGQLISQSGLTFSERESYLEILQKSTNRLINTVNDYMDASLIASGNLKVSVTEFPVNLLLDEMYGIFKPQCDEKHLELRLQIPDNGKDHQTKADRELIKKVLLHLIGNAVKFTNTGMVTFGYKVGNSVLEFFVKDTGIGIRDDKIESIFKAFDQEEIGSTRTYEGSGLGLTITKGIIDKLGGKIWLNTEKGKGTEFYFTMQRASAISQPHSDVPGSNDQNVDDNKRLALIAEDDDSNYFYLDVLLRKASFRTLRAVNGREAVELFKQHPDIRFILMDIKMPIMDGLEATAIIKSEKPDLPIIAITAYALTGDENRIKQAGCDDYIAKPLTRETLIKKLQTAGINIS